MFKLVLSVFALSLVSCQPPVEPFAPEPLANDFELAVAEPLVAEPVAAEPVVAEPVVAEPVAAEPLTEAELLVLEDIPGIERAALNGTGIQATNLHADKYGVYLEHVRLSKCQHFQKYLPYFYNGLVVNSRGWMTKKGEERFTSMALLKSDGTIISSTSGAWPAKKQLIYHTWEMLHFGIAVQDIRIASPDTLRIQSWNAGQQIYVPLFVADEEKGWAFMLHIYPEPSFLAFPNDYTYADGLLWAKGDTNRLYKFDIDLAGLIRNLDNFSVPNYQDFITPHGVVFTNGSGSQSSVVYSDVRHIDVHGLSQSSATEYICRDTVNAMGKSWNEMRALLDQQLTWL